MNRCFWLAGLLSVGLAVSGADASSWKKDSSALAKVNHKIQGRLVDFTANHGHDNRMWSRSLGQRRDLYVYLPPCYDKNLRYPFMLLLHGFAYDEQSFLDVIPSIDDGICKKELPPMIIAIPDGSIKGEPSYHQPGSFFLNSGAGNFEDFVLQDVWDHVVKRYPIRSERDAHIISGVSMGGFAAFNLGMRYRENFGVVAGLMPPLNLRWIGADGRQFADFDPHNWGWRETIENPNEVIARFGIFKVRVGDFVEPLYGLGPEAVANLARENPIELVDRTHLRDGQLKMYVGYGGKDEYNIDAQVESFLYLCKFRGITVNVGYDAEGRHEAGTVVRLIPSLRRFLLQHVGPYAPNPCDACQPACATGACGPVSPGSSLPLEYLPTKYTPRK